MFTCEKSCPGYYLFAQVVIPDFEGGDELKESSEVKGSLGPTGFRSAFPGSNRVPLRMSRIFPCPMGWPLTSSQA